LNLSKNKLGAEGAKHLADALKNLKVLSHLDISFNEIGDNGIIELARSIKDYGMIEYLDISGNKVGKSGTSSTLSDCGDALYNLFNENRQIEIFKADWNNLRGA